MRGVTTSRSGAAAALPTRFLIGSEWIANGTGGELVHHNPATGKPQATVPMAGAEEVDAAVASARLGLATYRRWTPAERAALLHRIAALLRERSPEFSAVCSLESGQIQSHAQHAAVRASQWFDYYAGWADKLNGEVVPAAPGFNYTMPEPYGVVAIILTWNGPTVSIGMKVAAALGAGCAVVLKSPELAPFTSNMFGQVCLDAGIPPGVLNVISGGREAGTTLVRHPDIDKISFTGGPETARAIQADCAQSLTPLVLELGGKSANLVFADADVERAAALAAGGITMMAGQVCIAPSRLLVERSICDEVSDRVVESLARTSLGDPFDPSVDMGPVISERACERIVSVIDRARADGAGELAVGGERVGGELADGYFVQPTAFVNVDPTSSLAREEVFGPVLAITPFDDESEAIAIANDSPFGLAAYVQTSNVTRALRVASQLDAGNVAINGGTPSAGPVGPFGGFKNSGYGKEGGLAGILEFVRIKNVNIGLNG